MIKEKIGCKPIRTDPDAADFNIYRIINQVCTIIEQLAIKSTKNSFMDDLSRDLEEVTIELRSKCKKDRSKLIK